MNAKQLHKKVKQILLAQALSKKNAVLNNVLDSIGSATKQGKTSIKWSDSDSFWKFASYEIAELEKRGFTITKNIGHATEEDLQWYRDCGCGELTPQQLSGAVYEISWDKPKNRVVSLIRYYLNKCFADQADQDYSTYIKNRTEWYER